MQSCPMRSISSKTEMREAHRLQSLGHDHGVKAVVRKVRQASVEVLLHHIDAAGNALTNGFRVNLQSVTQNTVLLFQARQQRPITAT